MTYLDRAIKDGYAIITGPENKQKIIYVTSDNHTENYNDPEEKVRAEFWAELIYEYDYPAHRIKVEVTIPDRVPTDRADIVIFSDDECKKPYAVVECKRDGVTDAEFLQAIEQGVGNATWVKLRASYVVIIAGATRRVLDFSDDSTGILERENNIIADLPKAYGKPQAFRFYRGGEYTDVDGKKKKAPDIQPVAREDLITAIKKSGEFKYLEISGVSLGLNKYRTTTVSVSNAPSRAKMKTQDGDIVIALTRPHRGAIAQIKESGVISSTGFSVIRKVVTQIDREWLLFVLLSNLSLQQMLQRSSGGNYPAIIEDEVKRIYIPIVDYSKQLQMAANMRTKAKEFDAQIQTSNSFLNNTLFILERVGLTFDKDNNNLAFAITRSIVEDRIDADYYSPRFVSFRNQIEQSRFPAIPVGERTSRSSSAIVRRLTSIANMRNLTLAGLTFHGY